MLPGVNPVDDKHVNFSFALHVWDMWRWDLRSACQIVIFVGLATVSSNFDDQRPESVDHILASPHQHIYSCSFTWNRVEGSVRDEAAPTFARQQVCKKHKKYYRNVQYFVMNLRHSGPAVRVAVLLNGNRDRALSLFSSCLPNYTSSQV
jgi:hypothetical protein